METNNKSLHVADLVSSKTSLDVNFFKDIGELLYSKEFYIFNPLSQWQWPTRHLFVYNLFIDLKDFDYEGMWITAIILIVKAYMDWMTSTTVTSLESVEFNNSSIPCLVFALWNLTSKTRPRIKKVPDYYFNLSAGEEGMALHSHQYLYFYELPDDLL